jgi:hypothetical protein
MEPQRLGVGVKEGHPRFREEYDLFYGYKRGGDFHPNDHVVLEKPCSTHQPINPSLSLYPFCSLSCTDLLSRRLAQKPRLLLYRLP